MLVQRPNGVQPQPASGELDNNSNFDLRAARRLQRFVRQRLPAAAGP
jgi:hypothetical protein